MSGAARPTPDGTSLGFTQNPAAAALPCSPAQRPTFGVHRQRPRGHALIKQGKCEPSRRLIGQSAPLTGQAARRAPWRAWRTRRRPWPPRPRCPRSGCARSSWPPPPRRSPPWAWSARARRATSANMRTALDATHAAHVYRCDVLCRVGAGAGVRAHVLPPVLGDSGKLHCESNPTIDHACPEAAE